MPIGCNSADNKSKLECMATCFMFKHIEVGALREALLSQLISYYEMGNCCLLLRSILSSIIAEVLSNLSVPIPLSKWHKLLLVDMDKCTALELIIRYNIPHSNKVKIFTLANVSLI